MNKRNYNYSTTVMLPRSIWPYWHWHEPEEIFWWHSKDLQPKYSFAWTAISLEQSSGLHASCHLDVSRQSHVSNCCHRRGWSFVIATKRCCLESRSWSCDWGKLALRSIWAPSRAESTHTENGTQGSSNIRRGFACHFSLSFIWGRLFVNCLDSAN